MCGIAGFWNPEPAPAKRLQAQARAMGAAITHRGPDAHGEFVDAASGLALAHTRLSILDLSPAGAQPMASASGRYQLVFNGEIYNHTDIREMLAAQGHAPAWRGHSDTETLLAAIDAWGLQRALQASVGMFALALWDSESHRLQLARDRIGEKPLYWGWQGKTLLFGSELKALRAHPAFVGELDHGAVALMTRYRYLPAPHCIYAGLNKLPAAYVLSIDAAQASTRTPQIAPYWRAWDFVGSRSNPDMSDDEAVAELDRVLSSAIAQQRVADVPLGALLSGGVDSSAVVALMQQQASQPVRTFTIGFEEPEFNEAEHAKAVARHLGTQHTELYVTADHARELIPNLPQWFDEPQGDYSSIPTYLVAQLARQQVTVALSGDGGDELFCGYQKYFDAMQRVAVHGRIPAPLRKLGGGMLGLVPHARAQRAAAVLQAAGLPEIFDLITAPSRAPVIGHAWARSIPQAPQSAADVEGWTRMMLADLHQYLPDQVLAKVDRASMAVSLETRAPMLDHRVVEFALGQPNHRKLRDGTSKWLLRQVLYRHVPAALIERPKQGFTVPIDQWLRASLRTWAEDLLTPDALAKSGCFDVPAIRKTWARFLAGDNHPAQWLWNVLMVQQWLASLPAAGSTGKR